MYLHSYRNFVQGARQELRITVQVQIEIIRALIAAGADVTIVSMLSDFIVYCVSSQPCMYIALPLQLKHNFVLGNKKGYDDCIAYAGMAFIRSVVSFFPSKLVVYVS